jgi:acetyltransferase-like isoleucine patch superfamily enzyme|tara:strand:- start:398 stop:1027 length:630 start_codon:yes stop_codon:yes gene_type:complete
MIEIFKILFGKNVYWLNSFIFKYLLRFKKTKIGKNFYSEGRIKISTPNNIYNNLIIGDNVLIMGDVEFLLRGNGKIFIGNNVKIDNHVRLLAANDAKLEIKSNTNIGKATVINSGADITIGENVLISGNCYIQSSSHSFKKDNLIKSQKHEHEKIEIENDVWLGAGSIVLKGIKVAKGTVLGANSLLNIDTDENSIFAGSPAKKISSRN